MRVSILRLLDNTQVIEFKDVIDICSGVLDNSVLIETKTAKFIIRMREDEYMAIDDK